MSEFGYLQKLKRRVPIVDDEEINREILGNMLCDQHEIAYAANGPRPLPCCRKALSDMPWCCWIF
ncbi:MAG: hypothetical protein K6E84_02670 [Lachnospiraceae bacterium]|nr:hypothetical protein [Lachnospiraceae bacterium]